MGEVNGEASNELKRRRHQGWRARPACLGRFPHSSPLKTVWCRVGSKLHAPGLPHRLPKARAGPGAGAGQARSIPVTARAWGLPRRAVDWPIRDSVSGTVTGFVATKSSKIRPAAPLSALGDGWCQLGLEVAQPLLPFLLSCPARAHPPEAGNQAGRGWALAASGQRPGHQGTRASQGIPATVFLPPRVGSNARLSGWKEEGWGRFPPRGGGWVGEPAGGKKGPRGSGHLLPHFWTSRSRDRSSAPFGVSTPLGPRAPGFPAPWTPASACVPASTLVKAIA